MTTSAAVRPQKVTFACLFVGISCLLLLISIGDQLSNWGSIELREQIAVTLSEEPLAGAGLEIDSVLTWLRWVLLLAAAITSTGIIFAVYTARGHQPSRIILTVMCGLASLVFIAGGVWGILPAAFAIGAGFYLWAPESRAWFAVKNGRTPPETSKQPVAAMSGQGQGDADASQNAAPSATDTPSAQESARDPYAAGPAIGYPGDGRSDAESGQSQLPARQSPEQSAAQRPTAVLVAGLITIVMSALVLVVCGVNAVVYFLSPSAYIEVIESEPMIQDTIPAELDMTAATFAQIIAVVCAVLALLSVCAIVAAVMTLRRVPAGRIALIVLSAVAAVVSVFAFPVGLPWTAAAIAAIVVLTRSGAKAWFAAQPS